MISLSVMELLKIVKILKGFAEYEYLIIIFNRRSSRFNQKF